MTTKFLFQKGATVLTKNGIEVGMVERVVVDTATNSFAGIVVHRGGLLKSVEKVVPARLIADATEDLVLLQEEAGVLESMPPFEEERLVKEPGEWEAPGSNGDDLVPLVLGNPITGVPVSRGTVSHEPTTRIEQNIPEGTVAVKEGAKVVTAEGRHIGNIEQILADPTEEEITHLRVSKGLLTKETKLLPTEWVESWGEEKVRLKVKEGVVDSLKDAPLAV